MAIRLDRGRSSLNNWCVLRSSFLDVGSRSSSSNGWSWHRLCSPSTSGATTTTTSSAFTLLLRRWGRLFGSVVSDCIEGDELGRRLFAILERGAEGTGYLSLLQAVISQDCVS